LTLSSGLEYPLGFVGKGMPGPSHSAAEERASSKGGGDARFGSIYAMVVYAWLPANFVYLIAILSLVAGVNADSFFIQNPAATNLGALIDPVTSPVLYALLSSIDVFTFWSLILMAIGLPCISKVKRGTATAIVFGWFAFWVLVKMGIAAIS